MSVHLPKDKAALSDWNGNFITANNGDTLSGAPGYTWIQGLQKGEAILMSQNLRGELNDRATETQNRRIDHS